MSEKLLDNISCMLCKTNPKLTTNVKVVVDSTGGIFLESFDANDELSKARYKNFRVGPSDKYEYDLKKFYNKGLTPTDITFSLKRDNSDLNVHDSFAKQYEFAYTYGAEGLPSKYYEEEFSMLAPIWLEKNVPDYFIIFRIDDPVSVSNRNVTN